jgi:hypothetical protein
MPRSSLIFAAIAGCALVYAAYVHVDSGARLSEVSEARASIDRALARERVLADGLRDCQARLAADAACEESVACDCSEPAGDLADALVAPDGQRLASPEDRDAYLREYLQRRIDRTFPDEAMDEWQRRRIVDVMVRIRALVEARARGDDPDQTDETLRDELDGLQEELRDLSGMGPAELLDAAGAREAPRALRPHEAEAIPEGEERKRFADEISRRLGVARPGAREVFEAGEWHER